MRGLFPWCFLFLIAFTSCTGQKTDNSNPDFFGVNTFISLLEYDLAKLEDKILEIGDTCQTLFEHQEVLIANGDRMKYKIEGVAANSEPGADMGKSCLYVSKLATNREEVEKLILITNPLDTLFLRMVHEYPFVSQVYFNSPLQLNRLYPPYDINTMLEPDLDLSSFNFYYEADATHNPNRRPVWVDEMYIDPVGRGWMISLAYPVYHQDELKLVLGLDITLNDIIENYINKSSQQLLIVDHEGTVVAGKSKTIEAFSLPPLKNHTYTQTITSDSYRKEDFNLFKSRDEEVRRIADRLINNQENELWMATGQKNVKIISRKMNKLNWFVMEIFV